MFSFVKMYSINKIDLSKVIMQGKLFQRCTNLLYCNALSLGDNVNTIRMSKPDMGSIFHKSMKYSGQGNYNYVNYQNYKKCNAFNLLGYLTNTDASILVYNFRPGKTAFNMYAERNCK